MTLEHKQNNQRGFGPIWIVGIVAVLMLGFALYLKLRNEPNPEPIPNRPVDEYTPPAGIRATPAPDGWPTTGPGDSR